MNVDVKHKVLIDKAIKEWKKLEDWRAGVSFEIQEDLDRIFYEILSMLIHGIRTKNTVPFGFIMADNGKTNGLVAPEWFPDGNDMVDYLIHKVQENRKGYKAVLIAWQATSTNLDTKKVTHIYQVYMEHFSGVSIAFDMPYIRGFITKKVSFDFSNIFIERKEKIIWCENVTPTDARLARQALKVKRTRYEKNKK